MTRHVVLAALLLALVAVIGWATDRRDFYPAFRQTTSDETLINMNRD
jgi:hypothetical protein